MRSPKIRAAMLCAALFALGGAGPASGTPPEPDFVFTPKPAPQLPGKPPPPLLPPPTGYLEGPCGLAVDGDGRFYVADYYHHAIDVYDPNAAYASPAAHGGTGYIAQLAGVDPLDGPCALAFDGSDSLYVNSFHRGVAKYGSLPGFAPGPVFPLPAEDPDHHLPTGIAVDSTLGRVYVNNRTYISVYDLAGNPVLSEGETLRIGEGSLGDGYGLAVSGSVGTLGYLYVPDAATDTVKIYDPALADKANPVAIVDGSETPTGEFGSLLDSAVAVDAQTGEFYVIDTLGPQYSARPQATVFVFYPSGEYEGRLKYNIVDAVPPGLAVDNSSAFTGAPGRVYVTSGNSERAAIYAYPPGSSTHLSAPPTFPLALSVAGAGKGQVASGAAGLACASTCEAELLAGERVSLSADPAAGSTFAGWSGGGCEGTGQCVVTMSQARTVSARFLPQADQPDPADSKAETRESFSRISAPHAGASVIAQKGTLRVSVDSRLSPKRLPRKGVAPTAVSVGWRIGTTDGTVPAKLKMLRIEINRNGILDTTGLPTCPLEKIQPASTSRALKNCRPALVGRGNFSAIVGLKGQEAYVAKGRIVIFNAEKGGKPVLYGQIYSVLPFANSFVITFNIEELGKGIYGTALTATLPPSFLAWGTLTEIEMRLSRRFAYDGKRRSFLAAGCPAPKGFPSAIFRLARTSFAFVGGAKVSSTLIGDCKVRR